MSDNLETRIKPGESLEIILTFRDANRNLIPLEDGLIPRLRVASRLRHDSRTILIDADMTPFSDQEVDMGKARYMITPSASIDFLPGDYDMEGILTNGPDDVQKFPKTPDSEFGILKVMHTIIIPPITP